MLGFSVVEGRENFIHPASFQEIRGWVTGPLVVAEIYGLASRSMLTDILENYKPDYLELSLTELNLLKEIPIPYILYLKKGDTPSGDPEFVLTEMESGFSATAGKRLVLAKTGGDVDQLLKQSDTPGIALKGGIEIKPGLKDYQELSEIFEMLETDD